jgi:hypothetical protein
MNHQSRQWRLLLLLGGFWVALVTQDLIHAPLTQAAGGRTAHIPWRISGEFSEACSCSVPCTCNFGEAPSPHHFCWALWSLDIHKGHYGKVRLDGLRVAGAHGEKGFVTFIDERATPTQLEALKAVAQDMQARTRELLAAKDPKALLDFDAQVHGFKVVRIEQGAGKRGSHLVIGSLGGFESDYILGIDGKTPVIVENNVSWNIQHAIKGKTKRLHYKDEFGSEFDMTNTNANQGLFDWSDKTPVYVNP